MKYYHLYTISIITGQVLRTLGYFTTLTAALTEKIRLQPEMSRGVRIFIQELEKA